MAQPETCILVNRTKQLRVYNLPHAVVPEAATMRVVATREHNPKTGERIFKPHRRPVSGSITLLPSGTSPPQPMSVLRSPDIQAALKRKEIEVKYPSKQQAPDAKPAELPEGADATAHAEATGAVQVSAEEMEKRRTAEAAKAEQALQGKRTPEQQARVQQEASDAEKAAAEAAAKKASSTQSAPTGNEPTGVQESARHASTDEGQKQAIPGAGTGDNAAARRGNRKE